ncbi:MAG: hypothetical protein AMXMBFR33_17510 [Candidatus Xenobia bacterium]
MPSSAHETVPQKAKRLVEDYRTILTSLSTAVVIGDHNTYKLARVGYRWTCDCNWFRYRGRTKPCSHVLAVEAAVQNPESQTPVLRLASMLGNNGR